MNNEINININNSKEPFFTKAKIIFLLKILVIVLVMVWIIIVFVDYMKARKGETPIFCLSEETKMYSDGTTYSCTGLGYKIYNYDRSFKAVEFGPFFIKERTSLD